MCKKENNVRIIINTNLLKSAAFLSLEKQEIVAVLTIADYIFNNNSDKTEGDYDLISSLTGLSTESIDRLIKKEFFKFENENIVWTKESISWFKNNSDNVKKSRSKKTIVDTITTERIEKVPLSQEDEKEVKKDKFDYESIVFNFNTTFTDFKYVCKVQGLNDKRKTSIRTLYEFIKKSKFEDLQDMNISEFYDNYFAEIASRKTIKTSYTNQTGSKMFEFRFDFFLRQETFLKFYESDKYMN